MPRVVSLFLPRWPTDRIRRQAGAPPDDVPLVLVGRDGRRRVVTATDEAAHAAGLRPGMTAARASALMSGLDMRDADPQADAAALERLALWALERFSPIVAIETPDGVLIDSTGAEHLHGGEQAFMETLVGRLAVSGVTARAAMADSRGAAHALARFAARPIFHALPGHGVPVLSPLPLAALRLPPGMVDSLRVLGFERLGDLLSQPRAPLIRRFGPELGRRMDQITGDLAEPITPLRPEGLAEAQRLFAEPIGAPETIARHIGKLVVVLCAELENRGVGARRLDLICQRVDNTHQAIRIGLARPVRDEKRLSRLLRDKIETIAPGFGIEKMTLSAPLAEPLAPRQQAHVQEEEATLDLSGLIDVLANRVGEHAVYRVAPMASDVPERSVRRMAPLDKMESTQWPDHWPRPARLFARPEPIETMALLPDHPPAFFLWRGTRYRVQRADGPERIFAEWWKQGSEIHAVRDYFRVEDEAGARYWIYRAGDGEDAATGTHRWYLHGIFG